MSQIIDKDTQELVESAVAWALSAEGRKEIQVEYGTSRSNDAKDA